MQDGEPMSAQGEFFHKKGKQVCSNDNETFRWLHDPPRHHLRGRKRLGDRGIVPFQPKKFRRAQRRGAKLARKMRPR